MVALRLIRLIEEHSDQIAKNLVAKIQTSPRTRDMKKIPESELLLRMQELLHHLGEWLLTKSEADVETRYYQIGIRQASQGVALADSCWTVTMTKEFLWEFLQRQGLLRSPIELYGEMELMALLNQFFDQALCYVVEGYDQARHSEPRRQPPKKYRDLDPAAFVP